MIIEELIMCQIKYVHEAFFEIVLKCKTASTRSCKIFFVSSGLHQEVGGKEGKEGLGQLRQMYQKGPGMRYFQKDLKIFKCIY